MWWGKKVENTYTPWFKNGKKKTKAPIPDPRTFKHYWK